ncbi:TetR/AcrR family transcriptional regulator [Denitrobaculum tricleocarpae]|uniref:TetR/AcrR family transcriptional regulator n=1 Tax=Denitrobaculum tricleocarpae TaxID=2591009 RepID=A0A545TKC8_9PROT|nr:TetR/AcrR family transcriptional regulator [Denitrobaculum tricleocarpae]TQV77682.1 TetR/AcrR family transcriptional regulator [Denitrobaculum tricleocarpae]
MSNLKRAERSRLEILDASWDLIAERGAAVSMAEIAAAVGMTRQSIYVHFSSRGGLLMALVRRADERFFIWEGFESAMEQKDPAARLDAVLKVWLDFVPKIHPVATDLIRMRATDEDAARAWDDRMSELLKFYRGLVGGLKKEGALSLDWSVPRATDYLWASSSVQAWDLLVRERGWSEAAAAKTIRSTICRTLIK